MVLRFRNLYSILRTPMRKLRFKSFPGTRGRSSDVYLDHKIEVFTPRAVRKGGEV
jgi:hypothetical protein